jgi:hypothetical protein
MTKRFELPQKSENEIDDIKSYILSCLWDLYDLRGHPGLTHSQKGHATTNLVNVKSIHNYYDGPVAGFIPSSDYS